MDNKLYIEHYCSIENGEISLDGEMIFSSDAASFADFSKEALRHFEIQYPKFFKMDALSKLAFLGSELVLKDALDKENTALLFSNASSSLDTDVSYQQSISDKSNYFPSPAVFVYTLPNICLGEISIRHQLKTENSFFIFGGFNPEFLSVYAENLIGTNKAESVLCGWVELLGESYRAFLYLVKKDGKILHDIENISRLYNQ